MYRAVVLTTLVMLLLAIVGVSVAQESRTFSGGPNGDDPPGSTTQERTSVEATGWEDTTASPLPSASSEAGGREDDSDRTVVTEPTVAEPEKPAAASPREETPTPSPNASGKPGDSGRGVSKPEHAAEAPKVGKPPVEVGHHPNGHPEERGRGAGQHKVVLCHKGNKTLTVGAPALAAHLRHDDTRGPCQGEVSGSEPPGEAMGPEAAKSDEGGGSGGRGKVIVCHKKENSLPVGAGARAAHMRHGDSLGACP
jgi:hypothetical protein